MDNIYHQDNVRPVVVEVVDPMTQFIRSIYNLSLIFIGLTIAAWLLLTLTTVHVHKYLPFPTYVLVIFIFLAMVFLNCIPSLSYSSPCKWMMTSLVVVCTIISSSYVTDMLSLLTLCLVLIGVSLIILVLNFSGAKCPQEFLPGGVCSTTLMIVLGLLLIVVAIAQLCTENVELLDAFISILFIMVIIAIPIQAQFNHGRLDNVEVIPKRHLMVCTLTLYLHAIMFFCCVCYFILVEERKETARLAAEAAMKTVSVPENDFD
ncbi:uncharacterized protein LOC108110578 [Drosophila eugracilis]|uniref:uncharacterized protein LOC108110578 n=1 Tax=Drosophila eugracilis TaxID=29029 RepID=UPI0007E8659F|nr:uncharacterized protein LOC108110578 [Drosophila eugracilis]